MRTRKTLDLVERMMSRDHTGRSTSKGKRYYTRQDHIRAELDRLARRVRKLLKKQTPLYFSYARAIDDVLALLKEAKK